MNIGGKKLTYRLPLQIAYDGLSEAGKSYLAASFVKEYDGIYLDFSEVLQSWGGKDRPVKYQTGGCGHGGYACIRAGINMEQQYKMIRTWDDYEQAVEYALMYRDDVSQKENKRIWIIIDDTSNMRENKAIHNMIQNKHKQRTTDDWRDATVDLKMAMSQLAYEFNCIYINQMTTEFETITLESGKKEKTPTGRKVGMWYPYGLEHMVEVKGTLVKTAEKRIFTIVGNQIWDSLDLKLPIDVEDPTPTKILEAIRAPKEQW